VCVCVLRQISQIKKKFGEKKIIFANICVLWWKHRLLFGPYFSLLLEVGLRPRLPCFRGAQKVALARLLAEPDLTLVAHAHRPKRAEFKSSRFSMSCPPKEV
jgi:hypothetical protein